jgi:sugar-specific transcriptional regulator TrmB
MRELKFAGSRPVITASGISFYDSKRDKFIYIQPAFYLLNTVIGRKEEFREFSTEEIFEGTEAISSGFKDRVEARLQKFKKKLQHEVDEVEKELNSCSGEECRQHQTLLNNLLEMIDYREQRGYNKIVYKELIEVIAIEINRREIESIDLQLSTEFTHIAVSLVSVLNRLFGIKYDREITVDSKSETGTVRVFLR